MHKCSPLLLILICEFCTHLIFKEFLKCKTYFILSLLALIMMPIMSLKFTLKTFSIPFWLNDQFQFYNESQVKKDQRLQTRSLWWKKRLKVLNFATLINHKILGVCLLVNKLKIILHWKPLNVSRNKLIPTSENKK